MDIHKQQQQQQHGNQLELYCENKLILYPSTLEMTIETHFKQLLFPVKPRSIAAS